MANAIANANDDSKEFERLLDAGLHETWIVNHKYGRTIGQLTKPEKQPANQKLGSLYFVGDRRSCVRFLSTSVCRLERNASAVFLK